MGNLESTKHTQKTMTPTTHAWRTHRQATVTQLNSTQLTFFPRVVAARLKKAAGAFSRTSVGLDLASAMLGSEGCLGIITSVVVKVVPIPEVSEHASFLFRDFQVQHCTVYIYTVLYCTAYCTMYYTIIVHCTVL